MYFSVACGNTEVSNEEKEDPLVGVEMEEATVAVDEGTETDEGTKDVPEDKQSTSADGLVQDNEPNSATSEGLDGHSEDEQKIIPMVNVGENSQTEEMVMGEVNTGNTNDTKEQTALTNADAEILQLVLPTNVSGDNTTDVTVNQTLQTGNVTLEKAHKRISCIGKNTTGLPPAQVKVVNSTELLHRLSFKNETQGNCALVLFYAPWCMFCSDVAPHYNALARAFPQLDVLAIDAIHFSG